MADNHWHYSDYYFVYFSSFKISDAFYPQEFLLILFDFVSLRTGNCARTDIYKVFVRANFIKKVVVQLKRRSFEDKKYIGIATGAPKSQITLFRTCKKAWSQD